MSSPDSNPSTPGHVPDWRSFYWLNGAQFFGALNDNLFKLLIVFSLIARHGDANADRIFAMAGVVFVTPFLLFNAASGALADRVSKRTIIVAAKALELGVMILGAAAFVTGIEWMLYVVLFCMATQSTLFGPAKYGIVPEMVGQAGLSRGNSMLTALTYLAIIIGTGLAPFLSQITGGRYGLASLAAVGVAIAGLSLALPIRHTPSVGSTQRPSLFFLGDIARTLREIRKDRFLLMAVLASAYFLMLGAFVQMNVIPFGIQEMGLTKEQGGYMFLLAALGIGTGAVLSGLLSGRNIELGVVPIGAFGLTGSMLALALLPAGVVTSCVCLFLLGVSSGLFIVPLNAFIQFRSPKQILGKVLATNSFLSWVGVLLASAIVMLFSRFDLYAREGFLVIGFLTLGLSISSLRVLPDFLVRFLILLLVRFCYRLKVVGAEHVPVEGPALLVANHVSHVDAALMSLTQQRRIRFLMYRSFYEKPAFRLVGKLLGTIPVSVEDSPREMLKAMRTARKALDDGYLVCIFPEGAVSRTGGMRDFKAGMEVILKKMDVPVIPAYIGGAWGSIFSYAEGRLYTKRPRRFPYPASIHFGAPMPASTKSWQVQRRVMELGAEYIDTKKRNRRPLEAEMVRTARTHWRKQALNDTTGRSLTFGRMITSAFALAGALREPLKGQSRVGVMLPSSVGGALTNLALQLMGKTPVNLNFTASGEGLQSAVAQAELQTVITSITFMDKAAGRVPQPEHPLYLEDLAGRISGPAKVAALLKARLQPLRLLPGYRGFDADKIATIIFSSGTTGIPKGVPLSHHNIQSNIEAFCDLIQPTEHDNICAVLPFFHSFGYTCTLWLPVLNGFSVSYHPNPVEGAVVGKMARDNHATLLIATPTFLMAYLRRAKPADFSTLRLAVVGAEKLKVKLADAFEARFGIRPLEGYGATECAPVISVNIPDVEYGGLMQLGNKPGSVGQAIPGVAVKVVDPESGEEREPGESGVLLVKGPNVMSGYLDRPDLTAEALHDGWYRTGDIVRIDPEGFITITDRLSRFSKIGGEMIPHTALEDVYYNAFSFAERVLAVTSVPDEKKGERLVVLYTPDAGDPVELHRAMADSDLPNLWKPAANAYFQIEEIPHLGSGKLDIQHLRQRACERAGLEG